MNTIIYILLFIMGTLFGSFYTLAVYRIPKKQDIIHTHSYCPKCNHKLGFLDLIPVLSYIFLGAKCRYCKKKIRPRYFILEILSGFTFVVLGYLFGINIYTLTNINIVLPYCFFILYFTFVILMAATERENRRIEKSISVYGIIISILYMAYLCIIDITSIYRYVIYLIFYIIILLIDTITLKKRSKNSYVNGILLTIITMTIFTGEYITIATIIFVLLIVLTYILLNKLKRKTREYKSKIIKDNTNYETLPIGFFLGVANIIYLFVVLIYIKII